MARLLLLGLVVLTLALGGCCGMSDAEYRRRAADPDDPWFGLQAESRGITDLLMAGDGAGAADEGVRLWRKAHASRGAISPYYPRLEMEHVASSFPEARVRFAALIPEAQRPLEEGFATRRDVSEWLLLMELTHDSGPLVRFVGARERGDPGLRAITGWRHGSVWAGRMLLAVGRPDLAERVKRRGGDALVDGLENVGMAAGLVVAAPVLVPLIVTGTPLNGK